MTAILRGEDKERTCAVSLNGPAYSRRFLVRTTSVLDGPQQVVNCDGIPRMLTRYDANGEFDPDALVIDVRAVPRESPTEWHVDVDYGVVEEEFINGNENPFNRPIEISGGLVQRTKLTTRDWQGTSIVNSAGDPYAAQEIEDSLPEMEITRVEAGFSLLALAFYKDALNIDGFLGYPPGTLKMQYIGFRTQTLRGVVFTEVNYHIAYREHWWLELLDEGFYTKEAGVKTRITVKGEGGRLIFPNEPQLLDGSGGRLEDGADPRYRAWHMYPRRPFSGILQGMGGGTGFAGIASSFGLAAPGQRQFPGFG